MNSIRTTSIALLLITLCAAAFAKDPVPVNVDNFVRAETDHYFAATAKGAGGLGKFYHIRHPTSIEHQTIIRMNRDTLYSAAVFDVAASPVTLTLPDASGRFMSLMVVNEDHYVQLVAYDDKPHVLTAANMGTRYVQVLVRTLVDPNNEKDMDEVHRLQDRIKVSQDNPGVLELPDWDEASLTQVRQAVLGLARYSPNFDRAFGAKDEVDPIRHLIGTAAGWGGNPDRDARYTAGVPAHNDGKTIYRLTVPAQVPVDAFWSVSVYDGKGYFEKNALDMYSVNNITASKNPDGSVTIQFGGCDGKIANCIPTPEHWNYTARMYRPRAEILSGQWKFPEAQPVP